MNKTAIQKAEDMIQKFCADREQRNEIIGDSWQIASNRSQLGTLEDFIAGHKIDLGKWEIERWVSTEVEGGYRIRAFLKKRKNVIAIEREIAALKAMAAKNSLPPKTKYKHHKATGNMLEINIPDVHLGKQAWPEETGYEPYDVKIAPAMYMRAVRTLIERVKGTKYEQILYVIGNDMLNSDNMEGQTTSGTQVTNDARYHKVFAIARTTVIWAIQELRKIAPVKVVVCVGNHDQLSSFHLGDSIQSYFHAYDDVTVDNSPKQRKYHEFGNVMIAFTHGNKGQRKDYPLLIATEQPEMFGRTKFREVHTGHTHQTKTEEQHGVRVRVLPSLAPPDDWHSENTFVGNLRNAEAYTWNKTEGLTGIAIYNDQSQEPLVTSQELK